MTKQTVLVVGGAGYVGSHACLALSRRGFRPVVYDNLSSGHSRFVRWGLLEEGDIRDADRLDAVFARHRPVAVLHFAAMSEVGESVRRPHDFYETNVIGSLTLLHAAERAGVRAVVFSSTCATYGVPDQVPVDETHRQAPINPYGSTKLAVENALRDFDRFSGLRSVCLRYFNAAGADPEGRIGEWHARETHALPLAIAAALGLRESFQILGTDYTTRDGTCVRDYVHVLDLADAHVRAVEYLLAGGASTAINLGTGSGTTVRELVDMIGTISGRPVPVAVAPRRPGDAPILVADNRKAEEVLGWTPRHDLSLIVATAWAWHARNRFTLGAAEAPAAQAVLPTLKGLAARWHGASAGLPMGAPA